MQTRTTTKLRKRSRAFLAISVWLFGAVAAQAHQSPANCNGNGVVLNMSRSPSTVINGGVVTYNISIANVDDPSISLVACDVTNTTVVFYCPAADGTTDFANPIVITTNLDLPAGTPAGPLPQQMCTISVNAGVTNAVADVRAGDQSGNVDNPAEGALHDATVDDPFRSEKLLGTEVITTTTSTSTSTSSSTSSSSSSTSSSTSTSTSSSTSSSTSTSTSTSSTSTTSVLIGCRITGGIITPDGGTDDSGYMGISKGTGGGQVGAPCGCIGCYDDFDHIQGEWTYSRKSSGGGNLGTFHASDYNSLECGCDDGSGGPGIIGTGPGNKVGLCNPGDRDTGPEPRPAPANVACFTGVGTLSPPNLGKRTQPVAFRIQVQDRGEPGAGKNAGPSNDVFQIEIWIPQDGSNETPQSLANQACCFAPDPTLRAANINDGGSLNKGNIQIHPETPTTEKDICPPPPQNGSLCTDRIAP